MSEGAVTEFMCHFTDGSIAPIEVRGSYGAGLHIGVATRGDGYKRVLFFEAADGNPIFDPWVRRIQRAPKLVEVAHAR